MVPVQNRAMCHLFDESLIHMVMRKSCMFFQQYCVRMIVKERGLEQEQKPPRSRGGVRTFPFRFHIMFRTH